MDLWEQPLREDGGPRGAAKPVVSGIGMRYAVFSPDGRQLAYSQGKFRLANVWKVPIFPDRPATWEDSSQVTFDNAFSELLDVSADGTRLLVSSDRAGNQDLWMVPIGGGEMQQLTADPSPDWCPRWSPDGREISFYSFRSGNRDIWVMPSRGGTPRQITQDPARDWYPSWSPDGRELAFVSNRTGARALWIKSLEGGELRLATEGFSGHVVWSTDGKWLFVRKRGALWRLPVGGGEAEVLVENVQAPLAISLDGTSLIFGRDEDLWMVSLDKKVESQVASLHDQRGDLGQTLGTDGEYMYFTWNQDLGDIWVMDVVTDESE